MARTGNVKEQRKRRRKNVKAVPRSPDLWELIDGNWSHYPYGYCSRKCAYLTKGLCDTHRCQQRNCNRFERLVVYD